MNKLYIILCLMNIIAIQIHAVSIKSETIYDVVTRNFNKTCPTFNQNILVNNLSKCKEITIRNLPTQMTKLNMNVFYCVGMMIADLELCNSIALYDDKFLPKNSKELNAQITEVKHQDILSVCKQLKSMKLFNSSNIIPKELTETVNELKAKVSGHRCAVLCTDINGDNINDFCAMIYYLNSHLDNITKVVDIQNKENKTILDDISPPKQQNHQEEQIPANIHIQDINKTNQQQSPNVSKVEQTKINTTNPPVTTTEQLNNQKQLELSSSKLASQPETKKTEKPTSPPAEHENEKPQVQTVTRNQKGETTKVDKPKEQTPVIPKDETQSQNQLPNEATNDNLDINLDKSEFALAEGKEYPLSSTTINYVNSGADNLDTDNDIDINTEEGDDDEDPKDAQNIKDIFSNTMENSPNTKQVTEDLEESNFFSYFMFISVMFIAGYVVYHNKQKIMALLLEGRRDRNSRRRPSTSSYRKLNSNLEEAVTSKCSGSASHVIY